MFLFPQCFHKCKIIIFDIISIHDDITTAIVTNKMCIIFVSYVIRMTKWSPIAPPLTLLLLLTLSLLLLRPFTAQKMKFFIKDVFSKCHQSRSFLRIWSHLLKKALMENCNFCAVIRPIVIIIIIAAIINLFHIISLFIVYAILYVVSLL